MGCICEKSIKVKENKIKTKNEIIEIKKDDEIKKVNKDLLDKNLLNSNKNKNDENEKDKIIL